MSENGKITKLSPCGTVRIRHSGENLHVEKKSPNGTWNTERTHNEMSNDWAHTRAKEDYNNLLSKNTTEGYNQMPENKLKSLLESVLSGDLVESKQSFASLLADKIAVKLAEAKITVAQNFFESKADDLWKSAEDEHEKKNTLNKGVEKSDEVGEDEEKNNAVRQIKAIHDEHHNPLKAWDPTKHRDENEAENPNDKRVQGGAAARAAKGENTKANELISYNHADGSKSVVNKDDSNVLFHTLSGAAGAKATIKKDTREKLLSLIHKNPEGLKTGTDLVKKLLSSGDKKHFENSIYESVELI